ncbi:trigger factor, partial [Rhizobium ruizarguesonis]
GLELVHLVQLVEDLTLQLLAGQRTVLLFDLATDDLLQAVSRFDAEQDFEFTLSYEVLTPIELKSVKGIKVTSEVIDISDDEVNEKVLKVAESARAY